MAWTNQMFGVRSEIDPPGYVRKGFQTLDIRDFGVFLAGCLVFWDNRLFLDEPTNNLDPPSRQAVADALSAWKVAIILVSHDTEFVEQLAPTKVLPMPDG
jgi:hypothetical protein